MATPPFSTKVTLYIVGHSSKDTVCVEEVCVDGFRFNEIVTHKQRQKRYDGILGLGTQDSVRSLLA